MMKQQDHLQIFDLILTVRSPLFIGDGRMYTKAEYLYCTRNGRASLLDEQKFFTFLTDRGLIDRYIQFMLCDQSNLRDFLTEDCGVSDTDLNALTRYTIEAGDAVTNPPKNLYTFQRDAYGKAYIPGSSLKGALRTVWLLQAVRADQSTGHSLASDDNAAFPEEKYINQLHLRLQEDGSIASDAVNSLFRGVQVSDSKPIPNERMALCGKFDVLPDGSFPKNSKKGLPLFRECAIPGAKVRFKLTLDQSVLKGRITKESLMDAIQQFDTYYEQTYSRHFTAPSGAVNLPQQPHLILGGGSGFFAKSLAYPYLGEEKGLRWTAEQMTQMFSNHKHQDDVKPYGISPHTMKYARFRGQFYPYGYCEVSIL